MFSMVISKVKSSTVFNWSVFLEQHVLSPIFWLLFMLPGSVPDTFSPPRLGSGSGEMMRNRPDPDPQHYITAKVPDKSLTTITKLHHGGKWFWQKIKNSLAYRSLVCPGAPLSPTQPPAPSSGTHSGQTQRAQPRPPCTPGNQSINKLIIQSIIQSIN